MCIIINFNNVQQFGIGDSKTFLQICNFEKIKYTITRSIIFKKYV